MVSAQKIRTAIKNPKIALDYLLRKRYKWVADSKGITKKKYKNYSEYIRHQKSKFEKIKSSLDEYDVEYHAELRERLREQGVVRPGMKVLCLAARLGTEVKSFLDMGCFAIGLDLNPGKENKYVVYGDFHKIHFPDNSVDVVFTNSLDHVFDFDKFIGEIKRVLANEGYLILEIIKWEQGNPKPSYYEALFWKTPEDVLKAFLDSGFKVVKKSDFEYPWKGEHITLSNSD